MKRLLFIVMLGMSLAAVAPAQEADALLAPFIQRLPAIRAPKDFKIILRDAETALRPLTIAQDKVRKADALTAMAGFRQDVHIALSKSTFENGINVDNFAEMTRVTEENIERLRKELEQATAIYSESSTISKNSALAWQLFGWLETTRTGRSRLSPGEWAAQCKIGRQYYERSLEHAAKVMPTDAPPILMTLSSLAQNSYQFGDFERALTAIETWSSLVEKKFGPETWILAAPLSAKSAILGAAGFDDEARSLREKVGAITKKTVKEPFDLLLTERAVSLDYNGLRPKTLRIVSALPQEIFNGNSGLIAVSEQGRVSAEKFNKSFAIVTITVDTSGNVVAAKARSENEKGLKKAEAEVRKWKFKPLNIRGEARSMKGYVVYNF